MNDKLSTLDRRRRLQELEAKGITSTAELARQLGVTERCIRKDIEALDLAWKETQAAAEFRDRIKRRLVTRAERRYAELEAEWQRSKKDKEKATVKVKGEPVMGADGKPVVDEQTQATEGRLGDPAFMREMRENDVLIGKTTGVLVDKVAPTNPDGTKEYAIEDLLRAYHDVETATRPPAVVDAIGSPRPVDPPG